MGHHLLLHNDQVLAIRDWELGLLRHVLIEGAGILDNGELQAAIQAWEHVGPGVWLNVNEDVLVDNPDVFDAAERFVSGFSGTISVDYLNESMGVTTGEWLQPQSTERVKRRIEDVRSFFKAT